MGILALLSEIYALDKLKLNLKFEIEMLFKDLDLQIAEVSPSEMLRGMERETGSNNPDFTVDKALLARTQATATVVDTARVAGEAKAVVTTIEASDAKALGSLDGSIAVAVPGMQAQSQGGDQQMHLHAYVVISPNLQVMAERLQLKRIVPVAVDRAICEIITPVVERSVTIACMTTQELILKDFAMEPDEVRMRKAAHQMVSSLAGSLALVTCKEPLRVSLSNQLRQLLSPSCPEQQLLEQTISIVSQDNLDLGCTIIEKAATDKAVRDIDERLMPGETRRRLVLAHEVFSSMDTQIVFLSIDSHESINCSLARLPCWGHMLPDLFVPISCLPSTVYQMRQKARASGQPFYDPSMESRIPASLPEALRPRPGHLNPQQQRVYDDFSRMPRAAAMGGQPGDVHTDATSQHSLFHSNICCVYTPPDISSVYVHAQPGADMQRCCGCRARGAG